ncbi:tRNA (N6-threonylcarbamoyladenosine(37)-N6)-methyltransferase TrmO [Zongyangia hominis]|uniref:tRNA (N6-threonylcarbamoyladenosine(37)-N6)-methyltransferase TrmO n=1 Tax=Zongyangia hominis TaxID=2763677 RepID=A0A926ECS6_9FIRM|nr:tRNA (N6-threonylcarbamoyladenosine(37)-N6)-methyltransferase TrmO [Zongyangia hominis]MBC8571453.1 tRNA (N6-threonylcarbamoyladenosine(37)-N6)-methyltransferase TrmO [Zongyangia hominis]
MAEMQPIAHIHTDFPTKFGIPRQSGLIAELRAQIYFEPAYRIPEAFRGLEGYSHLWLLWEFSESICDRWSPTVKPPRLGGNKRMGVFATRSPFRPNPIGLSCVRLEEVALYTPEGPILYVSGADLMDGTPIYDIKPYLPYADCVADAVGGFADQVKDYGLQVEFPIELLDLIPVEKRAALMGVLEQDPRPGYRHEEGRMFGVEFAGFDVRFTVSEGILTVREIEKLGD